MSSPGVVAKILYVLRCFFAHNIGKEWLLELMCTSLNQTSHSLFNQPTEVDGIYAILYKL